MRNAAGLALGASIVLASAAPLAAQTGAGTTVTLDRAALAAQVKNDQRVLLAPGAGERFLWVTATLSGAPRNVDLTQVVLTAGSEKRPLIGVDSAWGGDPTQFSMVARASSKDGRVLEPLEETRSTGDVGFAFAPGKSAVLKVIRPPQKVCLLFAVPGSFRTGQISGLNARALPLPPLAAGAGP